MKSFKIYQVNGLGKKTEITTIVADSFQLQIWASAKSINFYQHEVGWFGRTETITLIGHIRVQRRREGFSRGGAK